MKYKSVLKLKGKLRDHQSKATAVIIFTLSQSLLESKEDALIPFLVLWQLICLVVIDKIYLATSFGNTFRKEFGKLNDILQSKVNLSCICCS